MDRKQWIIKDGGKNPFLNQFKCGLEKFWNLFWKMEDGKHCILLASTHWLVCLSVHNMLNKLCIEIIPELNKLIH